ncbi:MAG: hypothetical protein AAB588_05405, partial [Patescibacteria group bacterium]
RDVMEVLQEYGVVVPEDVLLAVAKQNEIGDFQTSDDGEKDLHRLLVQLLEIVDGAQGYLAHFQSLHTKRLRAQIQDDVLPLAKVRPEFSMALEKKCEMEAQLQDLNERIARHKLSNGALIQARQERVKLSEDLKILCAALAGKAEFDSSFFAKNQTHDGTKRGSKEVKRARLRKEYSERRHVLHAAAKEIPVIREKMAWFNGLSRLDPQDRAELENLQLRLRECTGFEAADKHQRSRQRGNRHPRTTDEMAWNIADRQLSEEYDEDLLDFERQYVAEVEEEIQEWLCTSADYFLELEEYYDSEIQAANALMDMDEEDYEDIVPKAEVFKDPDPERTAFYFMPPDPVAENYAQAGWLKAQPHSAQMPTSSRTLKERYPEAYVPLPINGHPVDNIISARVLKIITEAELETYENQTTQRAPNTGLSRRT